MRSPRVLAVGLAVALSATVFAACSGSTGTTTTTTVPTDPVLAEGMSIYKTNCASCHGSQGQGGFGKKLAGVVTTAFPNIDDEVTFISNGKGSMPAFGKKLTAEQLNAVARWTREGFTVN